MPIFSHFTHTSRKKRLLRAALLGGIAAAVTWHFIQPKFAPLASWDAAALFYVLTIWNDFHGYDHENTSRLAKRDDINNRALDVIMLGASLMSLVAVFFLLTNSAGTTVEITLALLSVLLSWTTVHTFYTIRYAALYYSQNPPKGVDFGGDEKPRLSDFAYLAFTLGMTYQVSDTTFQTSAFRRTALSHALLSFLFGTSILATTINFIAGLLH